MPMDYTTLIADRTTPGSIRNWANNALVPVATVLDEAQALIYQQLRVREMRWLTPLALAANAVAVDLPPDFLDPIDLRDPWQAKITLKEIADIESYRAFQDGSTTQFAVGVPSNYAIYGEQIQFDMAANAAMNLRLAYYRTPPALSADNLTNFLTRRYPMLLRQGCMVGVYDFLKNTAMAQQAASTLTALIQKIPEMDDLSKRGIEPDTSGD